MPPLPPEVVLDILSRLPVKTLLRFRCVSKPWCSNIDSPNFIRLHLNRSLKTNLNILLIDGKVFFIERDSLGGASRPVISQQLEAPVKCPLKGAEVLGSFNGLLCICKSDEEFALWNPSTRKHHLFPIAPIHRDVRTWAYTTFGFGFDTINEDYKVVRIVQAVVIQGNVPLDAEVMVYSLRRDSWTKFLNFKYFVSTMCMQGQGAYADGALHWVILKNNDNVKKQYLIVAFDLGVEEVREMPQPEYGGEFAYMSLSVLGGCLCVCYYFSVGGVEDDGYHRADVWVMKESSWIKLFSMPNVLSVANEGLRPLAYSKSGEQVISEHVVMSEEHCAKGLLLYDLKKKKSRQERIVGVKDFRGADTCVGSLVPINPGRLNKEKQEREQKGRKKGKKNTDDFLSVGFKLVL